MKNLFSLMAASALAAGGALTIQPGQNAPTPTGNKRPKAKRLQCLRGYYNRYSHAMTEMKVHLNFKHPFSETKRSQRH